MNQQAFQIRVKQLKLTPRVDIPDRFWRGLDDPDDISEEGFDDYMFCVAIDTFGIHAFPAKVLEATHAAVFWISEAYGDMCALDLIPHRYGRIPSDFDARSEIYHQHAAAALNFLSVMLENRFVKFRPCDVAELYESIFMKERDFSGGRSDVMCLMHELCDPRWFALTSK